jgi:lysozyme
MLNQATIDLVKEFEGLRTTAYKDSAGVWTIGYGTTGRAGVGIDPVEGMEITEAEAEYYLQKGLEKFSTEITGAITQPINENEFGAFVSLAYNIGSGAFKRSTALRKFNAGDKQGAANAMLMWNKAGGRVLNGLVRRREAERALFLTPVRVDAPVQDGRQDRTSPAQSRTVQASVVAAASATGSAVTALSALDSVAQYIVLGFAGIGILMALWIMRERLRKWSAGDR